jgi:hypothetical protein
VATAAAAESTVYYVNHLRFRPPQKLIFHHPARHKVIVAGSRFGKTTLALIYLIVAALRFPRSRNWYVSPTRVMSKDIAWTKLKLMLELVPRDEGGTGEAPMVRLVNESELKITLVNGSVIQLMTGQDPERLRGRLVKTVVLDEYGDMNPKVWTSIRPRLGDKELRVMYGELGRSLFIGTPKGFNHFKDLYDEVRTGVRGDEQQWKAWRYTSLEGGNIDATEIQAARLELSARDWRQEYEATFESIEGRIYHSFLRDYYTVSSGVGGVEVQNHGNLDESVHDMGGPLLVGADFNVQPMCWTVSSKVASQRDFRKSPNNPSGIQYELHTWKEYRLENANTQTMIKAVKTDFPGRHIVVHPDPHVGRHTTSANVGETDHSIIEAAGADVFVPRYGNNSDRYNTTNGLLCNSLGHRRGIINPKTCPFLVKCLDSLCFVEGSNLPDKSKGYDHITDAYSYDVLAVFPIVHDTVSQSTVSV